MSNDLSPEQVIQRLLWIISTLTKSEGEHSALMYTHRDIIKAAKRIIAADEARK